MIYRYLMGHEWVWRCVLFTEVLRSGCLQVQVVLQSLRGEVGELRITAEGSSKVAPMTGCVPLLLKLDHEIEQSYESPCPSSFHKEGRQLTLWQAEPCPSGAESLARGGRKAQGVCLQDTVH